MDGDVHRLVASDHLNFIRGMAALCVLLYHIRYRFFLDYNDLEAPGWHDKVFYGVTGLGHDAVVVFFVLSGFFIAESIRREWCNRRWSAITYLVNRLTRLYVVVIPALLLTVLWDTIGLLVFRNHPVYTGASQQWLHDFFPVEERLTFTAFIGNIFFLQTIEVPPLGTNDPLWSLAFEFWYYMLFPLIAIGVFASKSPIRKLLTLSLAIIVLLWLGTTIAIYFPIWLVGASVSVLPRVRCMTVTLVRGAAVLLCIVLLAAIAIGHSSLFKDAGRGSVIVADYLTGVSFAALVYVLKLDSTESCPGYYRSLSTFIAEFSFTLYVVHMPVLVLIRACLIDERPWRVTLSSMGVTCLIAVVVLLYAFSVARVTECRTEQVRSFTTRVLRRSMK